MVKFALLECPSALSDQTLQDPGVFFSLPQQARLAKVRELRGSGEVLASLVNHALAHELKHGVVSELDLFEILSAYVARDSFKAEYKQDLSYDGYGEFRKGKDIEALWTLVPRLPEGLSRVLIENLPPGAGLRPGIPDEVLGNLSDRQLEALLFRDDIEMEEFRKQLYFDDEREAVRSAAIACNFDLKPTEFARVLNRPERERVRALRDLSSMGHHLSLSVLEAIHDCLFDTEVGMDGGAPAFEYAEFAKITFERRLNQLRGGERERQIRELRLYYLARKAVPWKHAREGSRPRGELEFLADCVVPRNTWETYSRMSAQWGGRRDADTLERHLPRIRELDEHQDPPEEDDGGTATLQACLENHLAKITEALQAESVEGRSSLPRLVARVAADLL